jgi:uncharacterized membrane protein YhaH (DUF805 family)
MLNFFFGFHGRIRRSHYFFGSLVPLLIWSVCLGAGLAAMHFHVWEDMDDVNWDFHPSALGLAGVGVLCLIGFWSSLALTVKRWHDVGVTGWFSLLSLPHFTHFVVFLLLCLLPGTEGSNRYGPDPRGRTAPPAALATA